MSKDAVENEDTSLIIPSVNSLGMENLPSDLMNLEDEQFVNQLLGVDLNSRSLDSGDSSHSSHMSQGSLGSSGPQPSPFASILQHPPQPAAVESVNPAMEVSLMNSIIRFRYDSELNNRRTGKEELLKIKFTGVEGNVQVLLHTVDTNNKKAHPYWLIGEKCSQGMYVATLPINRANNYECTCKATLKIPKRNEYQKSLEDRRRIALEQRIFNKDIDNDDYWTANKNMKECRDFRLYVEARGNGFHMHCITPPLSNAKEGKCFMIHRIMPYAAPASGIQNSKDYIVIVLTADSYIPKAVEVEFVDENIGWSAKATKVNIIKNCIECEVPPYKDQDLEGAKEVFIKIHDKQKSMIAAYNFMYRENTETQMAKKRKTAVKYCAPPEVLQASGIQQGSFPDQKRPVLKASRMKKQGSGGFLVQSMPSHTSTVTTGPSISHFGLNTADQLPQLIVKKEPTDTYEGACGYQSNSSSMFSAGEEVTSLLTRGQDPNLQSMSDNRSDQAMFPSVSLLLPSGSDGSDREVSMETTRPASSSGSATNIGANNYSQTDQLRIQKIKQDLKAGCPGQPEGQKELNQVQGMDDNTLATLLQNLQQAVLQNAGNQQNSRLTFQGDELNPPMYSISSSIGGRDSTPAQVPFPARQTFNPSLQTTTQDIQNLLDSQYTYTDYQDVTEAGDLETDGASPQAPGAVELVWQPKKHSSEVLSDTDVDGDEEYHNSLTSDSTEDGPKPEVVRAVAVFVESTPASSELAKIVNTCDSCNKTKSSESVENRSSAEKHLLENEADDLETDSCDQTDPNTHQQIGSKEKVITKSPTEGALPLKKHIKPQDNISERLNKLVL